MITTSLRELAALIHDGSVPAWLRETVNAKKGEIVAALARNQEYTLTGPTGEYVIIKRSDNALQHLPGRPTSQDIVDRAAAKLGPE